MQRLEVSIVVQPIYGSIGVKRLNKFQLVGEVADYSLSYSFNLEHVAVRHSGKSSLMNRERRGSCCVDMVISTYVT